MKNYTSKKFGINQNWADYNEEAPKKKKKKDQQ